MSENNCIEHKGNAYILRSGTGGDIISSGNIYIYVA